MIDSGIRTPGGAPSAAREIIAIVIINEGWTNPPFVACKLTVFDNSPSILSFLLV
jgi:hypothetical protein